MSDSSKTTLFYRLRETIVGKARNLHDPGLFHKISLIAFFAWVGLGADGLSSSCYGPEQAFLALKSHMFLGIFVAFATVITIFVISSSYSQIVELFPTGGGGYLVASKLLSPSLGMVSGSALLVDYVLTITLSIASGADALFSLLPATFHYAKLPIAIIGVLLLVMLNLRGAKESVLPLIPIFLIFIVTHAFVVIYALVTHLSDFSSVVSTTVQDINMARSEIGLFGMLLLILKAYSMGAGTYTGIEAVSNGVPMLREPKVQTAKKTMRLMAISLSFMASGLMIGYLLYRVQHDPAKTLNAVLLESITSGWNANTAVIFIFVTLLSEAVLLLVAAQTGFLDGPRVLANMAIDRWFPFQFALLSERFVTQNGILLMGLSAIIIMLLSRGNVGLLVVLYSINVFITFFLSQLGMVRHWWNSRGNEKKWLKKIFVNGVGLVLTSFILISVTIMKFHDGGWLTIFITGSVVLVAVFIKRYYASTQKLLMHLDKLKDVVDASRDEAAKGKIVSPLSPPEYNPNAKTAVILVSGFNGVGLHTLFNAIRLFGENFGNFFFIKAGIIDVENFKGIKEISSLEDHTHNELGRYVEFMKTQGFYSEAFSTVGTDVSEEISNLAFKIYEQYPKSVFFGGQIVFKQDTIITKLLYNYTTFAVQRRLHQKGIPFIVMPIRVA